MVLEWLETTVITAMHGQQSDAFTPFQSSSPDLGKALFESAMPPEIHPSSSVPELMSLPGGHFAFDRDDDDSGSSEAKRKKGNGVAGKSIEEELCRICGDRASGYHYNALSCEGCKGFFRRSITRGATYKCKYGGNCEMDMWMRRKCQFCRLRRCKEVGMKEECLLSEEQCRARDARRKSKQRISAASKKTAEVSPDSHSPMEDVEVKVKTEAGNSSSSSEAASTSSISNEAILRKMEKRHKDRILLLLSLLEKYEFPDENSVSDATIISPDQNETSSDLMLLQMTKLTVLVTHLIVEFAKCLPGFNDIEMEDQIVLLKAASTEVMALRAARRYEISTKSIVFANGIPCTLQNMLDTGLGKYAELVYEFCDAMALMETDHTEYVLLMAICTFSERPGLKDRHLVERIQASYVETLQAYVNLKRPRGGTALAKLLVRLADLRTIALEHSSLLVDMQDHGVDVPSLMREAYILQP